MRFVFVVLMLLSSLLAQTTVDFKSALSDFKDEKFKSAYEKFNTLFENRSDDLEVNFYLGRSAYEIGLYEDALSAYERVLISEPKSYRSRLELGRIYLKLGDLDAAKFEFYDVLASKPPLSVKKNISILLDKIEEARTRHKVNVMLKVGIGYDTDINANPGQSELLNYLVDQYDLNPTNTTADKVLKDSFIHETLHASHIYDGGMRGRYYSNSSVMVYNQNHNRYSEFDILYMKATTALSNRMGRYEWTLPLEVDKFKYGSDPLLHSFAFAPSVTWKLDKSSKINVWAKFRRKIYDRSLNSGRDSDVIEAGSYFFKNFKNMRLSLGYSYLDEDKKDSTSSDPFIDKTIHSAKVALSRPIANALLSAQYAYRRFDFKDLIGPKSTESREDDYHSFYTSLSYEVFKGYNAELSYQYIKDKSNYIPTDYDKQIVSLSMVHYF